MAVQSSESKLVVEGIDARRIQAQFTRFQMAIGLRRSFTKKAIRKLSVYGTSLKVIDCSKPTGFDMKDDVTIISLDTKSTVEKGELVAFAWSGCSFDAFDLKGESPQGYDEKLRGLRIFGNSLTSGTCGPSLCQAIVTSMDREIHDIFQPRREYSRDTPTQHGRNNGRKRTRHGACKPPKKTFLLLPNTDRCLHDFARLGCHLSNRNHVIEVIDLRELFQAWTIRKDYNCRSPLTGSCRTELCHDLESLSHHSQILSALCFKGLATSCIRVRCMSTLRAAVKMAQSDAGSRSWLRTPEQIDGGAYDGVSGSTTKESILPLEPLSVEQVKELCTQYHEDQYAFEKCLLEFRDHVDLKKKSSFESLFDLRYADVQQPHRHRLIKDDKHPKVFKITSRVRGKIVSSTVAVLLRKTIDNREIVVTHFHNLSSGCSNSEKNANQRHRRFLEVLKEGETRINRKRMAEDDLVEIGGCELAQNGSRKKQRTG